MVVEVLQLQMKIKSTFLENLIKYYEIGKETNLKNWLYETSTDGIRL